MEYRPSNEHRPLKDIRNSQTRIAEFEFRLANGALTDKQRAILEAIADVYPPLRQQGGVAAAQLSDPGLDRVLCALARGSVQAATSAVTELTLPAELTPAPAAPVRQAACLGLRSSQEPCALESLLAAGHDADADVRYQALVGLHAQDARGESFAELIAARLEDEDPEVAVVAAQITAAQRWAHLSTVLIKRWGELQGPDKLQFALCLAELITDTSLSVSSQTLEQLGDELIDALRDDLTAPGAINALQGLKLARAREPLEQLVSGWFGHRLIKVEAAGALYLLGSEIGQTYLEKSLKSSKKDARGYALRLVGRLKIDAFFDSLKYVAKSPEYHADTAVLALADFGGPDAQRVLADVALHHANGEVRGLAAHVLEKNF